MHLSRPSPECPFVSLAPQTAGLFFNSSHRLLRPGCSMPTLKVRCPECDANIRQPIDAVDEPTDIDITCPKCGQEFIATAEPEEEAKSAKSEKQTKKAESQEKQGKKSAKANKK